MAQEPICPDANSQREMNVCASELAEKAEAVVEKLYAEVAAETSEGALSEKLAASQEAWKAYRDAQCDFDAAQFEGGSMRPLVFHMCRAKSAERRAQALIDSQPQMK